ncbi:hypothetical protein RchiOBHm_Chr2g0144471 [Rosa chinensis]|uniref:Uncharacterized protein n=1 Tax=Rosa chinensis TaxID=74649 RepID=A0A2P6RYD8_ROSCH|nr:hypothetical protein RchiOBHm_Chr2g0144471 [Rosa chinensis]
MDNFMIRFASKEESALGMADVAPVLSGDTAVFAGMKIPSELAGPLAKFAERYSGGDIFSLIDRDYTSRKKCELVKELGMMLYSMEVCPIKDGEMFLIWRDACRDFMGAGLNVGFLLDSLKQGAKHFFGYMMRSEGSENQYVKIRGLQEMVSQTKKELARLEGELRKAEDDLSFSLRDVPVPAMECVLESSWKDDGHFSHYLY